MELVYHVKTHKYFEISDEDFFKFQDIFSKYYPDSHESAVALIDIDEQKTFSREYTEDEIKSIFDLDCEYSGKNKEISKDKVVNWSDREKSKKELTEFVKKGKPISKKSAKNILKVLEAFESYECEIN